MVQSLPNQNFSSSFMQALSGNYEPDEDVSKKLMIAAFHARNGGNMATIEHFNLIEDAVKDIFRRNGRTYSLKDQFNPLSDKANELDISNLTQVVKRIRYNRTYNSFSKQMTDMTLSFVAQDKRLVEGLRGWAETQKDINQVFNIGDRILDLQNDAANKCSKVSFLKPDLEFFEMAPSVDPDTNQRRIVWGYHTKQGTNITRPSTVMVNRHSDGPLRSCLSYSQVIFHEGHHSQQKGLGDLHTNEKYKDLKNLYQAGSLWHFLESTQSIVPAAITRAYRAQFHEVSAFSMGKRFEKGIKRIVAEAILAKSKISLSGITLPVGP